MGVTDKAVSKWERDLSYPDVSSIPKLAELFQVSVDELMQGKREEKNSAGKQKGKELAFTVLRAVALAMGVAVAALTAFQALGYQGGPVYAGPGPGLPGGRPVRGPGVTPAKEKKPWQPPGLSCCLRAVVIRGPVYAGPGSHLPGGPPSLGKECDPLAKEKKPWQPPGLSCCLGRPHRLVPFWRRAQPSPLGAEGGLQELREQGQGWGGCSPSSRWRSTAGAGAGRFAEGGPARRCRPRWGRAPLPPGGGLPRFAATSSRAASKVGAERNRAPKPRVV